MCIRDRDYDDQMVYALEILRRHPALLREIQERYQYFCVDEAQDTSKIQHRIVHLLSSQSKNIFMVGDEDQSIYGFRAAFPQALTGFDRLYPCLLYTSYSSRVRMGTSTCSMCCGARILQPAGRRGRCPF